MKECCLACAFKYSSLHQRTPIKRVINIELFFIVSLIEIGIIQQKKKKEKRKKEIGIRKVFHFIYLFLNFLTF